MSVKNEETIFLRFSQTHVQEKRQIKRKEIYQYSNTQNIHMYSNLNRISRFCIYMNL